MYSNLLAYVWLYKFSLQIAVTIVYSLYCIDSKL